MITAQIVPEDSLISDPLPKDHPKDLALIEPDWICQFLCPCGCGDTIHLLLVKGGKPRWDYSLGPNGELTISPSIDRLVGCKSHFFVTNGEICWC